MLMNKMIADSLLERYPIHIPLKVAAIYLGISPRTLSKLIAENREPISQIGVNIGTNQKYIRIYTQRMICYLDGTLPPV